MEDQSNGRHLRKGEMSLASNGLSWSTQRRVQNQCCGPLLPGGGQVLFTHLHSRSEVGSHEGCGRGYGYRLPRGRAAERRCQLVISRKCSESKEVIHKIKMEMCLYWHRFTDIKMSTFPELFLIFFNVTLIYFCNYV